MKKILLEGGLGNQLIIYSCYRAAIDRYVGLDLSWFNAGVGVSREFLLDRILTLSNDHFYSSRSSSYKLVNLLLKTPLNRFLNYERISFRSPGTFSNIHYLTPFLTDGFLENELSSVCAVHFRFGDYVNNPHYVALSESSYYTDAINLMINNGVNNFLVLSDDVEMAQTCISNIDFKSGANFSFSGSNCVVSDFRLMANSRFIITANSTLSYVASRLGTEKLVCQPKKWMKNFEFKVAGNSGSEIHVL